jgi:hypothetical protein
MSPKRIHFVSLLVPLKSLTMGATLEGFGVTASAFAFVEIGIHST